MSKRKTTIMLINPVNLNGINGDQIQTTDDVELTAYGAKWITGGQEFVVPHANIKMITNHDAEAATDAQA